MRPMPSTPPPGLVAIVPCNDLDASEAFYHRLGFERVGGYADYRILSDGRGGRLHLTNTVEGWVSRSATRSASICTPTASTRWPPRSAT